MSLPLRRPYHPMEALSATEIPEGSEWQYEPKWDGFRCLAFKDGDKKIELQSKGEKSLTRYFPELVASLQSLKAEKFVIDGEIIISIDGALSFDSLLQRIHPAESRIKKLAKETPARFVVFDLLVDAKGNNLSKETLAKRRPLLEAFARKYFAKKGLVALSPATKDLKKVLSWAKKGANALDGIIAKRLDMPYRAGLRDGMMKIKNRKTADCVVGGFRYASKGCQLGSLLLGLYDGKGKLNHVGFVSASGALKSAELKGKLEKLIGAPGFTGHAPGGPSRWSTERSSAWKPLKPKLVVEVQFDHFTGNRFRHGTKFLRWRPDKAPAQCKMEQAYQKSGSPLGLL